MSYQVTSAVTLVALALIWSTNSILNCLLKTAMFFVGLWGLWLLK